MLKSLFRKQAVAAPRVPDGVRVYAIGDIHGCDDLFADLLDRIAADDAARGPMHPVLVLLGDLVDRGPDSASVVTRALHLAESDLDAHFLKGNHEEIFVLACQGQREALRLFGRIGGRETALSYGIPQDEYLSATHEGLADLLDEKVPVAHLDFLNAMADSVELGDYLFVHAGIRPGVDLAEQRGSDLRWIRDDFLDHRGAHDRFVVHGHTITDDVDEQPNRLGIDTGAYLTGKLTAVGLEADRRWFLSTS